MKKLTLALLLTTTQAHAFNCCQQYNGSGRMPRQPWARQQQQTYHNQTYDNQTNNVYIQPGIGPNEAAANAWRRLDEEWAVDERRNMGE